jgi:hypothetical protein
MPATPHPAKTAFESHDDQSMIAFDKLHLRNVMADAAEVRNTDLSNQFGGIYVRATDASYKLDTTDVQPDDGINVIIDGAGNHFVKIAVTLTETEKEVAAAGDVTLADNEAADVVYINNSAAAPINVFLPSAAVRSKRLTVKDGAGNAGLYPITLKPKAGSGQTIFGVADGSLSVIDSNYSGFELKPRTSSGGGYQ